MKFLNKKKNPEELRSELEKYIEAENEKFHITAIPQYKILGYYADYYYPEYNIVLEVDGKQFHKQTIDHKDRKRDSDMLKNGYTIVRVSGKMVYKNSSGIVQILKHIKQKGVHFINTDDDIKKYQLDSLEYEIENDRINRINNWK